MIGEEEEKRRLTRVVEWGEELLLKAQGRKNNWPHKHIKSLAHLEKSRQHFHELGC